MDATLKKRLERLALEIRIGVLEQMKRGDVALHVGDEAELVNANRRQFAAALGVDAARFTTCAQVHGSKVVCVTEGLIGSGAVDFADTIADTDALITDLQNVPLLLFYADCVPVLLADTETGAVGLAHAGWRGRQTVAPKSIKPWV